MDTEQDFIKDSKRYYLGDNKKDFLKWIDDNIKFSQEKHLNDSLFDLLEQEYFDYYLDDLRNSNKAEKEKIESLQER